MIHFTGPLERSSKWEKFTVEIQGRAWFTFKNTPLDACGHGKPETVTITYPFGPFSGMTVKVTSVLRCSNRTYIHFVTDNDVNHSVPSEWTDYNEQMYGTKDVGTRTCKFSYDQLLELNKYLKTIIKS